MSARDAVTALRRFGLGARPGEIKRIAGDPRGYVLQSLTEPSRVRIDDPALEPSHVTFAAAMGLSGVLVERRRRREFAAGQKAVRSGCLNAAKTSLLHRAALERQKI